MHVKQVVRFLPEHVKWHAGNILNDILLILTKQQKWFLVYINMILVSTKSQQTLQLLHWDINMCKYKQAEK